MKIIYLTVAGFIIKIQFNKAFTYFYRKKWLDDMKEHFSIFTLQKKPEKIDYTIKFTERKIYPIRRKSDTEKKYINYIDETGENTITTFYIISIAQLELIFMEILCKLFKKDPGFFIHSSASQNGEGALLFTGTNGAGKSTIVKLLRPEFTTLSDDAAIIRKIDGIYYLYQSVHHEKTNKIIRYANRYPLKKVFFLKKSSSCKMVKISDKQEITKRLMSKILIYFIEDKQSVKHVLKFISEFDSFYELSFPKRKEVASFLRTMS